MLVPHAESEMSPIGVRGPPPPRLYFGGPVTTETDLHDPRKHFKWLAPECTGQHSGDPPEEVSDPQPEPDLSRIGTKSRAKTSTMTTLVKLQINNIDIDALVDTGAQVTIINQGLCTHLAVQPTMTPIRLDGFCAGGSTLAGATETLGINIGTRSYQWKPYVAPIRDSILLGTNFLQAHQAMGRFKNHTLQLGDQDQGVSTGYMIQAVSTDKTLWISPARLLVREVVVPELGGEQGGEKDYISFEHRQPQILIPPIVIRRGEKNVLLNTTKDQWDEQRVDPHIIPPEPLSLQSKNVKWLWLRRRPRSRQKGILDYEWVEPSTTCTWFIVSQDLHQQVREVSDRWALGGTTFSKKHKAGLPESRRGDTHLSTRELPYGDTENLIKLTPGKDTPLSFPILPIGPPWCVD